MTEDLKKAYRTVMDDHFPREMEISFGSGADRQTLVYEKVTWVVGKVEKGLRYGENPGQEAALYKLINGNLVVGEVNLIEPGLGLVTDATLHQFGKHPGKINLTDADNALNILRYLTNEPAVSIMKHNNPCGVALGETLADAYVKADLADRIAAFGGCIACNRPVDKTTAVEIAKRYAEVVVAPGFEEGAVAILAQRKNLRIMEIGNMHRLQEYALRQCVDFKSLIDGGLVVQLSFVPVAQKRDDLKLAETEHNGKTYKVDRQPSDAEYADMLFGWKVEAGVSSNSVIYVKDGVTVGIGTGEQDRVGVAEIARDKAYRKLADRMAFQRHEKAFNDLKDAGLKEAIEQEVKEQKGGLPGSVMISDAFFPFRDGVEVGLKEGVSAVLQSGGSMNDYQSIQACNEFKAGMCFTGQRSFKH
jgi:phosphoribosylaminoimidazolecarboxamide formyltransferase/IMP cyclohydrolase